jgi:energy-coupling factor transport system ATP-binding protein
MSHLRDHSPATLSGGQKQCLAIAAVLAMRPGLLVLDEPTASLDVPSTQRVMKTVHGLQREYGITVLMIEHRLAEAKPFVDRVVLMDDGRIVSDGSPEEIFASRENRERRGLRRLPEAPLQSWDALISPDGTASHPSSPILSLRALSAGYLGHPVIESIDLDLFSGEITALVGDNGAGKTTLALASAGVIRPTQGRVIFDGGRRPRPGLDVALLFQNPAEQLFTDTVDEEVGFGPRNYGSYSPVDHELFLNQADLAGLKSRRPTTLSAGQQQRTALAACLALRPRVIILDEPTLGQDWVHLQQLMDYLVILQADGASILLITHDFKLVHRYAQRVVLMKEGRITLQGKTNGHLPTMKSTGSRRLPKPKAVSSAMRSLGGSR